MGMGWLRMRVVGLRFMMMIDRLYELRWYEDIKKHNVHLLLGTERIAISV